MKKIALLILLSVFISCENEEDINNCYKVKSIKGNSVLLLNLQTNEQIEYNFRGNEYVKDYIYNNEIVCDSNL